MNYLDDFEIVIGLEIHAELSTKTKIFCSCKNEFGAEPNTNTCPVCVGFPGALPILNKRAIELGIKTGLVFGSKILDYIVFERKNYFYPDLSKAYQISQLKFPLNIGGEVELDNGKKIKFNRIHIEEDAGKLTHLGKNQGTLIDFNRSGVPLIEMVTEPDFSSAEEVFEFLKKVREVLVFEGIAKCKMEQGGLRCDVNLSLRKKGEKELGIRTEMKNLNSFKSVQRAIEYEANRQAMLLSAGEKIFYETRKWDDTLNKSLSMRTKETAKDYRFFPDPDILPVKISKTDIEKIKSEMVETPINRRKKYIQEYNLPEYDAKILTSSKYISNYFEKCVNLLNLPKKISNWIMVDLFKIVKEQETEEIIFPITEEDLTEIIKMVEDKLINKNVALMLLNKVIETKEKPIKLAKQMNLMITISDEKIIELLINLKNENKKVVNDYKNDPEKISKFIIGYVMKNTQGKANSLKVQELISKIFCD